MRRYRRRQAILKSLAMSGIETSETLNSYIVTALTNLNTSALARTQVPSDYEALYSVDFNQAR